MWGQIDGRPKLEIAREAVADVVTRLPAEQELGLIAYGHRSKGNCGDIELLVPPGNVEALTDGLLAHFGDRARARRQAKAARRAAESRFSLAGMVGDYCSLYESALTRAGISLPPAAAPALRS